MNTGIEKEFYTLRTRDKNELFPWDFIDTGVSRKFLRKEWERAMNAEVTPNCREHCSGCGASKFEEVSVRRQELNSENTERFVLSDILM